MQQSENKELWNQKSRLDPMFIYSRSDPKLWIPSRQLKSKEQSRTQSRFGIWWITGPRARWWHKAPPGTRGTHVTSSALRASCSVSLLWLLYDRLVCLSWLENKSSRRCKNISAYLPQPPDMKACWIHYIFVKRYPFVWMLVGWGEQPNCDV